MFLRPKTGLKPPRQPLSDGVVSLRPWALDDVPAIVDAIDGDPEIARWLDMVPQPYSPADGRMYVEMPVARLVSSSAFGHTFAMSQKT